MNRSTLSLLIGCIRKQDYGAIGKNENDGEDRPGTG